MFFYLYAYEPTYAGEGWKRAIVTWYKKFKESVFFRKLFLLTLVISMILFRTLLNRNLWVNPLSKVMGVWGIWETVNGEQKLTTECIENVIMMVPFSAVVIWTFEEKIGNGWKKILWHSGKLAFIFSISIEMLQLLLRLGTFQLSDIFYNTVGGVVGDVLLFLQDVTCISYWIKGRGAWYVAWLIPVYAVYPLYGRIAHNRNWLSAVLAIVEIIMMALIGIPIRFQSIAAATLAFLIGDFLAKFIKANSVWAIRGAASLTLISPVYFFGILRTQTIYVISFACIGISLCAILAVVLDHGIKSMKRMLAEVGGVSLESYLFNIYIISVAKMILGNRIDGFEGVCGYVCVAIIGMFLSVLVGKLEKRM